jgi:hypothetical protein
MAIDSTSTIRNGVRVVTTAGTHVQLSLVSIPCRWVAIQAQTDNTAAVAVGGNDVDATVATGDGILLDPGEKAVLPVDNLQALWLDALVNGEGVRFCYGAG